MDCCLIFSLKLKNGGTDLLILILNAKISTPPEGGGVDIF